MQTLPSQQSEIDGLRKLGPYDLIETLGRGGMGVVFRARDPAGNTVAVKTVGSPTVHHLASLRAEIHALRKIDHPGVVRVVDEGFDAGRPWFAMDLLDGRPLDVVVGELRPPDGIWTTATLRPVLRLVAAVCEPLAAMHAAGIVHRDLKPENILIRASGEPVIVDLGLARGGRSHSRAVVQSETVAGTIAYMAPEQMSGTLVDARTDLYALGCILFEILVGRRARRGIDSSPAAHVPSIPAALDALVTSLLQPRARDRIGHVADVLEWIATRIDPSITATTSTAFVSTERPLFRPPLSGRRELLQLLLQRLEGACAGDGACIVVEGESGIGKTHLVSELGRLAGDRCVVLPAPSSPPDGAPQEPLASWSSLFEYAADRTASDGHSPIAQRVLRDLELLRLLHNAFARMAAPEQARTTRLTEEEVIAALRNLLGAIAEERPVVVLLDDVQWADSLMVALLRSLLGPWLAQRRVLLVATSRTDERAGAGRALAEDHVERVSVGPLPAADLGELVADMLGVGEPPEAVVQWIARRAEGNPFLAAEYLRLVASEIAMSRELELPLVRVSPPSLAVIERLPTPGSVRELVGRRLAALDEDALRLAEMFAILGGTASPAVVDTIEDDRRDSLFELQRAQIVEPTEDGGRRLLHDRVRVVLTEQLGPDHRRALHASAAVLLARAHPDDPPHAAIAHHWTAANVLEEALGHLEAAGDVALARAAYDTATRHFEEARRVAGELAETGATYPPARRARWSLGAARGAHGTGDMEICERRIRDALALVDRELPTSRFGWIALAAREGAARLLPRRSSHVDGLGDVALAASILPYRYFFQEDLVPLVASALLCANLAERANAASAAAGPLSLLGAMAGLFRLPGVARRYFDRSLDAALEAREWRDAANVLALESMYQGSFARWELAEASGRRALEIGARLEDAWMKVNHETTLSHVEYFTGRFEAARERAVTAERIARDRRNVQHEVWGLFLMARSDLPAARWDDASRSLDDALAKLEAHPEMMSLVMCNGLMSAVAMARGDVTSAEALASWVSEHVRSRLPPAYPSLAGYLAAARTSAKLLAASPTPARWRSANDLAIALWRFAAVYPVALPAAFLHTAEIARVRGWRRLARLLFAAGAGRAARTRQPYERALLLLGSARASDDRADAATLTASGHELLQSLGATEPESNG